MNQIMKLCLALLVVSVMMLTTACQTVNLNKFVRIYNNNNTDFAQIIDIVSAYPEFKSVRIANKGLMNDKDYYTYNNISVCIFNYGSGGYINYDENRIKEYINLLKPYFEKYALMTIGSSAFDGVDSQYADDSVDIIVQEGGLNGAYGWMYVEKGTEPNDDANNITQKIRIDDYWYAVRWH